MKTFRQYIYPALLIIVLLFISSCHPKYYVKITDISDPSHPCFSISQSRVFPWAAGMGHYLAISEVDSKGNGIKSVWRIECYKNVNIKSVCYGKVPDGYKELIRSSPLEMNKYYMIYTGGDRWFYFKISRNKGDITARLYTSAEFHKKPGGLEDED